VVEERVYISQAAVSPATNSVNNENNIINNYNKTQSTITMQLATRKDWENEVTLTKSTVWAINEQPMATNGQNWSQNQTCKKRNGC
jgi:hypothetical protein